MVDRDERIGEVDVLLAGDAEHARDAFVLEALDEEFSGAPSSFSHATERTPRSASPWRTR